MLFIIVLYKCNLINSDSFNSITSSLLNNNQKGNLLVWDNFPSSQLVAKTTDS